MGVSGGAGGGQPPDGKPRVILRIRLPDRKLSADIAAKSLRKAQEAIREAGATLSRSFCKDALSRAT